MLLADVFGPGGSDDGLFDGMSLDLGDLFADDLMGNLLNVSGPSTDLLNLLPCTATPDNLQPAGAVQAPCSSGDSHHGEAPCTRCSSTTNSGLSSGQLFPAACNHYAVAAGVMRLPVQRSNGPPTRKAVKQEPVRQVTTQQVPVPDEQVARSIAPSPSPPSVSVGNPPAHPAPACFQHDELLAALLRSGGETSEDSDGSDTDEGTLAQEGNVRKGSNKRKAPEIDWRSITDPAERRRQRRLAKNRMTAARSRERKKVQWADMEAKLARMDSDNKRLKTMLQQLAQENSSLRGQLEGMVQGKQTPGRLEGHSHSTEPAALVFITILLLLCCALPGDQTMLLGSAAPMLLLAQLLSQPSSSICGHAPSPPPLGTALLRFLATLKLLLSCASARLRVSVHRMLFRRHYYVGRSTLSKTAAWAATTTSGLLRYRPGLSAPTVSFVSDSLIRIKQEPLCPSDGSLPYIKQEPLDIPMFDPSCLVSCLC